MRALFALLFLVSSLFAHSRDLDDFINITKAGTYDFEGEVLSVKKDARTPAIVIGDAFNQVPSFEVSDIILKNVVIMGNRDNQLSEYHNVHDYLRNNGITIRRGARVTVENVWVIGARSGGLVTEKGCKNITVRNSYFMSSYFDGVAACETTDSLFEEIVVNRNDYAGISLDWNVQNCIFRKIYSYGNKDWTIFQRSSKGIVYDQITSRGNGGGAFLAKNVNTGLLPGSKASILRSIFADARLHSVEPCCELILTPQ